jgi:hypothetical protein
MPTRLLRPARLALAGGLLVLPLSACSFTSDNVSCSGSQCTVKLEGNGASANILGNEIGFAGTQDGRAGLSLGDASVTCAQGESVALGPLSVTCTTVTENSVELTASAG